MDAAAQLVVDRGDSGREFDDGRFCHATTMLSKDVGFGFARLSEEAG